ncbi:hypothetical protein CURE108131_13465 [Cupriavidus respiraculi]|uniref:Uncharacterized protein n=1 Tax=Cupriavidus respiraculi TaxID=195930 RepID=A0ABM8XHR9_9BURK|nr:hypothetical protein [Cupriavidus respiraculi]MBY4948485.1 hypothetical protein [Cupriavidus respiraculi]CAG9179704.1 hypothetical protein LMG21510_03871 [Cupriavidus respiraculi]
MKQQQTPRARGLVEIWGDTADTGHLAWSIAIGAVVSLAGFLLASRALVGLAGSPELARAYAMLAGLGGCLLAGAICARLFPPKREVVEGHGAQPGDVAWREQALDKLAEEAGGLGTLADLPPAVVAELKELELYELFAARERAQAVSATPVRAGADEARDALAGVRSNAA